MKNMFKFFAAALAFVASTASAGVINNADFSNGLTGWSPQGTVAVRNGHAIMTAGEADVLSRIRQTIALDAGETFSGKVQFFGNDSLPYNDYAYLRISGLNLLSFDIATQGPYSTSGLLDFAYTATTAGLYTFTAGVANALDNTSPSQLIVSNLKLSTETSADVPEPASMALFGLGLGIAGVFTKRRKSA